MDNKHSRRDIEETPLLIHEVWLMSALICEIGVFPYFQQQYGVTIM